MAWLQDFHFLRPWWLIGLFLPLLIYVIAYRQTAAQSAWRKVCDENLLDFLLVKNEKLKKTKFSSFGADFFVFGAGISRSDLDKKRTAGAERGKSGDDSAEYVGRNVE